MCSSYQILRYNIINLDIGIANELEKILGVKSQTERIGIFERIDEAKSNISELTGREVLEKDAKYIDRLAISSIPVKFDRFLEEKAEGDDNKLEEIFKQFCDEKGVTALILLTVFRGEKSIEQLKWREVVVFCRNEELVAQIVDLLTGSISSPLDLKLGPSRTVGELTLTFSQGNIFQGRKDILPALRNNLRVKKLFCFL